MLPPKLFANGVWKLLEESYLESAGDLIRIRYATWAENDRRTALIDFAKTRALQSKRWAEILRNLQSAELSEYCTVEAS